MRDIVLTLIVFSSLPLIVMRPYVGLLVYCWISFMNPHLMVWGFAGRIPFAMIVGVVFLLSWLVSKEPKQPLLNAVFILTVIFTLWMCVTTVFALAPQPAFLEWKKVMKIMLIALVTMIILTDRNRIEGLLWVIVISIGFFGVRGGIFTLMTGGNYLVLGPHGSVIGENNEIAQATIMTLPLVRYLHIQTTNRYIRWALLGASGLLVISILGSHSRGAFLAIVAMAGFLLLKSRHKLFASIAVTLMCVIALAFLPQKWFDRMETIPHYDQDPSALSRINAWTMGFNLAMDRPIVGGGFKIYDGWRQARIPVWQLYAPNPNNPRAPHSNYFQILGHHGFPGLFLYLLILYMAFRYGGWLVRHTRGRPDLIWAAELGIMCQISLVGYAVGGLVINFGYYDVYWAIVAILVAARIYVTKQLAKKPEPNLAAAPSEPTRSFLRPRGTTVAKSGYLRG